MDFSTVLFWVCILLFLYNFYTALQSIAAVSWPTAEGELDELRIDYEGDPEGTSYEPVVAYRYKVGLNEYHSAKFAFGFMGSSSRFESTEVIRRIIERDPLRVYYHPRDPRKAVLLTGIRLHHIFQGLLFGVLALIAS